MPANAFSHFLTYFEAGDIGLGVLLEMELAALPGDGGKDGLAGGSHARIVIAEDGAGAAETAGDEGGEEFAPMDFGLAQGGADAGDGAFAIGADADECLLDININHCGPPPATAPCASLWGSAAFDVQPVR